jgi:hypothetical protein
MKKIEWGNVPQWVSAISAYDFDRDKHPTAVRLNALVKQIEKLQKDIEVCFLSVTP